MEVVYLPKNVSIDNLKLTLLQDIKLTSKYDLIKNKFRLENLLQYDKKLKHSDFITLKPINIKSLNFHRLGKTFTIAKSGVYLVEVSFISKVFKNIFLEIRDENAINYNIFKFNLDNTKKKENSKLSCNNSNVCKIKALGFVQKPNLFIEIGFSPSNNNKWIDLKEKYKNKNFNIKNIKVYKLMPK